MLSGDLLSWRMMTFVIIEYINIAITQNSKILDMQLN